MGVKLPIGTNFAMGQVRRLNPRRTGALSQEEDSLAETLIDHAASEAHAKEIITRLIRGWRTPDLEREKVIEPRGMEMGL